jgi:NTE family protein
MAAAMQRVLRSTRARRAAVLLLAACAALPQAGCAGLNPVNTRLEQYDPSHGYRIREGALQRERGRTIIYLALSGGGTRAAAFAYGVLEELRATQIKVNGEPATLLDEVDTISGVSGGSFPAAYYGLFGDRIFEEFEERFLRKNIQNAIFLRALIPWNLVGLMTPWLSRSDLAKGYYDKHIFDEATFADLTAARGPRIHINATDLSSGDRFSFSQGSFDLICSDLDALPIASAVAASSAVPVLLSPINLKNHAGSCGYEPPDWVAEALANPGANPRRDRAVKAFHNFRDSKQNPYIHLIDGATSDNLGLHAAIDFVSAAGSIEKAWQVTGARVPDRLVFIAVNAETDPNPTINLSSASPSFALLMGTVSAAQIRRYNFETLMLAEELLHRWGRELSTPDHTVTTYMINVGFDQLDDAEERRLFKLLPTSFSLSDKDIDGLRAVGRQLLRDSQQFQELLRELQ